MGCVTFFSFIIWAAFSYSGFILLQWPHPVKKKFVFSSEISYPNEKFILCGAFDTYKVHRTWPIQIFHQPMLAQN